jgi:Spy/CpxP family protein refolding chaperone
MVMSPKLRTWAMVLGIFVVGAGAGGAAGYAAASRKLAAVLRDERPEVRRFEALAVELDLTRDQRKKVREILEHHRDENRDMMRKMYEQCGAPVQEMRDRVDEELRKVLTPEQEKRFKELVEKRHQRFPFGPGPGHRPH